MSYRRLVAVLLLVTTSCGSEERPERDPAVVGLQLELLERGARDQAIRDTVFGFAAMMDSAAAARMTAIDRANTTWLKQQVGAHGWPSREKVGERASQAAFLIVQHAIHDPDFQRLMLDTITTAWKAGHVDGESYALLFDRVQAQAGRPQRYGTQARLVNGELIFDAMEDSSKVDSLRAAVGLPTMAVYRRTLDSVYRRARE